MKSAIAIAAIAGLASTAAAQSLSIDIAFADASIAIGGSTTATMTASFTIPSGTTGYMSAANFSVVGDNSLATASGLTLASWNNDAFFGPALGAVDGAGVSGILLQQHLFLGGVQDATLSGLFLASWTVTADAAGVLSYTGVDGVPFSFGIQDDADGGTASPYGFGVDTFSANSLTITPAPSAMALLGLGGLVAGRRRR